MEPHDYWIYYVNIGLRHQYGISARVTDVPPRETSPATKSKEKRMFSQATPQNKPWKQGAYVLCLLTLEKLLQVKINQDQERDKEN